MGYKRKTYKMRWPEGHELHGLEVSMRGMSMGDLGTVVGLQGAAGEKPGPELIDPLVDVFARNVVSWNVEEDDDTPVEPTLENIRAQDARMLLQVVTTWAEKATAVAPPLKQPSSGGGQYPEASIPMASL